MKRIRMNVSINITFEQGCMEYLQDCEVRNLRDGTLKHYRETIKQLYKYIDKDIYIKDMDKMIMDSLIIQLRNKADINEMSLYSYSRDLKTLMYFFMKREYIPTFKIIVPKVDKQPIETYSDDDLIKLLKRPNIKKCSFTEYKSWVIVNFLLSTGVRQNSLSNIKVKDVDFDNSVVHVNMTKNRKPLIIPLNENIRKILKEYLTYRNGEMGEYLFCNA